MSDKELIKQEIERLKHNTPNAYDLSRFMLLEEIESFINSIPEEPTSKDLEEVAYNYAKQHNELLGFDCDCEPIQTGPELKKAVIFGAEWQKPQMMKDAVECVVEDWCGNSPEITIPLNPQDFKNGDKVKIIIVKEE